MGSHSLKGFNPGVSIEEIYDLFRHDGITPEWLHCLKNGETKIYSDGYGIVNLIKENGILFVNSGTIGDRLFTREMLKDLSIISRAKGTVIISSTVKSIEKFMQNIGYNYDDELQAYIKRSNKWEQAQQ